MSELVDYEALAAKRRLTPKEAGLFIERDPETVRRALRSGEMHGAQRGRGGRWTVKPACAEAWVEDVPCEHQDSLRRPVSLAQHRMRGVA